MLSGKYVARGTLYWMLYTRFVQSLWVGALLGTAMLAPAMPQSELSGAGPATALRPAGETRSSAASSAERHIEVGLQESQRGELSAATKEFQAALRLAPNNLRAALLFSIAELSQQHAAEAVPYLRRIQAVAPHNEVVLAGLGQAYALLRQFGEAQRWYHALSCENPHNADGWFGLGVTYLAIQREAVRTLVETEPDSPFEQTFVADHLLFQGESNEAIRLYGKLAGKASPTLCTHARLGFAQLRKGAEEAAESEFRRELEQHPQCPLARLGTAAAELRAGQAIASLAVLKGLEEQDFGYLHSHLPWIWVAIPGNERTRAIQSLAGRTDEIARQLIESAAGLVSIPEPSADRLTPQMAHQSASKLEAESRYSACAAVRGGIRTLTASQRRMLAECSFETGRYEDALAASERMMNASPDRAAGLYWRALSAERLAVEALRRAALINPGSEKVHLLLAEARRQHEDFAGAEDEYRKAIEVEPRNHQSHLALAALLCNEQKNDEGLNELNKVLEMRPDDPEASFLKATILVDRGASQEALPLLRNALNAGAVLRPKVHGLLGTVYASLGNQDAAIAELKVASQTDPDGRYHYQLYRLYKSAGNATAAAAALKESIRLHAEAERGEGVPAMYRIKLEPSL